MKYDISMLKFFTDEQLKKELRRREKRRRGPVLGYRAICYGDDYNYGGYSNHMIGDTRYVSGKLVPLTKETAKKRADEQVKDSSNGGYVMEIYKDTPKEGVIH